MQYIGIHAQKSRNNMRSLLLLVLFPILVLGLLLVFQYAIHFVSASQNPDYYASYDATSGVMSEFISWAPIAIGAVAIWFVIAYFANTSIINGATKSKPLERKENKRVYNLVENLCMSQGMQMPQVNVIDDDSLNAFASGINNKSYAVTLTTGIIDKLDDQELEAVIAHELSHIRNHDVRLLIISIVFVGIFSMIAQISLRMMIYSPRNDRKGGGAALILLIAALLAFIGYIFSSLMRFAISRKREFLADAGSAEMTKNPSALANALRKISSDSEVEAITREDVAQLFIEHPSKLRKSGNWFSSLFATHPPIGKRIEVLEQF